VGRVAPMTETVREPEAGAIDGGAAEAAAAAPAPAPAPAPKKPPRLLVIDLLRFIAAASVVGMHWIALGNGVGPLFGPRAQPYGRPYARDIFPHSVTDILTYGGLGVELFFLISGFVICMSSWGRTLGQFGASRIARLFPAYWFAVLLTVGVLLAFPKLPMVRDFSLVRSTLINLTMTQSFFGVGDVDPVYWTLAQELRFYLMALSAHEREYENPRKVVAEHEPLMEAMRAGDARRAQREARHHIDTNAERVQRILAAHNDG